jgi:hypothetical protein
LTNDADHLRDLRERVETGNRERGRSEEYGAKRGHG